MLEEQQQRRDETPPDLWFLAILALVVQIVFFVVYGPVLILRGTATWLRRRRAAAKILVGAAEEDWERVRAYWATASWYYGERGANEPDGTIHHYLAVAFARRHMTRPDLPKSSLDDPNALVAAYAYCALVQYPAFDESWVPIHVLDRAEPIRVAVPMVNPYTVALGEYLHECFEIRAFERELANERGA